MDIEKFTREISPIIFSKKLPVSQTMSALAEALQIAYNEGIKSVTNKERDIDCKDEEE